MNKLLLLMLLAPLLGCVLNVLLRSKNTKLSGTVATVAAFISFLCAVSLWLELKSTGVPQGISYTWLKLSSFQLEWGFAFDALTAVMALIVTGVGTSIHLYSIGYMADDATPYRYFAYLNLFLFAMLVLISADNLPVLFVGWEGVGLCSYLLIGYWYEDLVKSNAGMKAFIVNRIGDAGFLIGMFLCFTLFNSLEFGEMSRVLSSSSGLSLRALNFAALFLFIGAMGKSAQIPLFVWLPDAMAGPTPVSALIHAATMVTAGVYLLARMSFLYQVAGNASEFVALIGCITALFAATIATAQRDIKKVLAYSTISQLGYMFLAMGVGAYFAGIFHLLTHAFFKALLFLGAGSVIHAVGGEQDICQMGGLRKKLPHTFFTFTIAVIAIIGIPPLAGFFSKDTILFAALTSNRGNPLLWFLGTLTSILTAFYMTRLYLMVFFGEYRGKAKPHESPKVMTVPLFLLAMGSIFAGFLGMPHGLHLLPNYLESFLGLPGVKENPAFLSEMAAMAVAVVVGIFGIGVAFTFYYPSPAKSLGAAKIMFPIRTILMNKYWVDELYDLILVRPFGTLCNVLAKFVDIRLIDAAVLFPTRVCRLGSTALGFVQSGSAQFYLWIMLVGAIGVFWVSLRGLIL